MIGSANVAMGYRSLPHLLIGFSADGLGLAVFASGAKHSISALIADVALPWVTLLRS